MENFENYEAFEEAEDKFTENLIGYAKTIVGDAIEIKNLRPTYMGSTSWPSMKADTKKKFPWCISFATWKDIKISTTN